LGTGRGEGKWRDVPCGECGVKKMERKINEDSRKSKNAIVVYGALRLSMVRRGSVGTGSPSADPSSIIGSAPQEDFSH
jgi:hypothetical protein